eukprot:g2501.t1
MKIIMTGILVHAGSCFPWGRRIFSAPDDVQWAAIAVLFIAALLTNPDIFGGSGKNSEAKTNASGDSPANALLGFLLALGQSAAGALGNVSCELLFKRPSQKSMPPQAMVAQNLQLYLWGAAIGFAYLFAKDGREILTRGPTHDFDHWTWIAIGSHTIMGLAASLVFKYLNNIVYLFIHVGCMLVVALISVPVFHFKFSPSFACALFLILISSYLYKRKAIRTQALALLAGLTPGKSKSKAGKEEEGKEQEPVP